MIKFKYDDVLGKILKILGTFEGLEEPKDENGQTLPLNKYIKEIHKISDADLKGKSIKD